LHSALKGNLNGDVRLYVEDPGLANDAIDTSSDVVEKGHGRIETRRVGVCSDIDRLRERHDWTGLMATGSLESGRHVKGNTTSETRCFLLDGALYPSVFLSRVRSHWGIENSPHWVPDTTMNEDRQRTGGRE